ncbi:hypothetical protein LLS1_12780 [Leifsonia sp. LS1]|uniref:hypothetical protein n=1 Tax=Leifsonia sp. LS1 TaxID=2828483 RepID=UPI001CFEF06C|nr:hypothetical protein [Leifsonia sp. LS1]GIT79609.1 hypothetical protein LLS1_12780 [Leifsonia sp. LS1]
MSRPPRSDGLRRRAVAASIALTAVALASAGYIIHLGFSAGDDGVVASGGAPPSGSAARAVPALLRALEAGDRQAVDRLVPGSPTVDVDEIMAECLGRQSPDSSAHLSDGDGPQAVLVVADGQPAYTVPRPGSCSWWMYWDQRHRSWTIGAVVGNPQPEAPPTP